MSERFEPVYQRAVEQVRQALGCFWLEPAERLERVAAAVKDVEMAAALRSGAAVPEVVSTVEELDALPIGSVIISFDPAEPQSPAIACRAVRGWQFLGDVADRRYRSVALWPGLWPLRVLFRPTREEER